MPQISLLKEFNKDSSSSPNAENSIQLSIKDNTYEYLMEAPSLTTRVSAYLEHDIPRVEAKYAELFIDVSCGHRFRVTKLTPGSRVRKGIQLPGAMHSGEQLVIEVERL